MTAILATSSENGLPFVVLFRQVLLAAAQSDPRGGGRPLRPLSEILEPYILSVSISKKTCAAILQMEGRGEEPGEKSAKCGGIKGTSDTQKGDFAIRKLVNSYLLSIVTGHSLGRTSHLRESICSKLG